MTTKLEEHLPGTGAGESDVSTLCEQVPQIEQDVRDITYYVSTYHPDAGLTAFEPAGTLPTVFADPQYGTVGWADDYTDGEAITATGDSVVDASTTALGADGNIIAMEVDMGTYSGEFVIGLVDTDQIAADAGGLGSAGQLDLYNDGTANVDGTAIDVGDGITWGTTTTGIIVDVQRREIKIYADDTLSGTIDLSGSEYDEYFANPENLAMRVVSTTGTGEFSATADEAAFTQTYAEVETATGDQTGVGPNAGGGDSGGQGPANDPAGDIEPSKLWRAITSGGDVHEGDSAQNMLAASSYSPTSGFNSTLRTDAIAISGSRVMIAENGVIHLSNDNGGSFTTFTLGTHSQSEAIATDGFGVWMVAFEAGVLYRTEDNGQNWTQVTLPVTDKLIYDIAARPGSSAANGRWMLVGQDGMVLYSKDGGATWSDETINSGVGHLYSVDNNSYNVWCAVGNGGMVQTTNEGFSWTHRTLSSLGITGTLYAICSDDNGKWVAGGTLGQVLYSENNAGSWSKSPVALPGGDDTIRNIASGDGLWLMGTLQKRLYWSDTNGIFWTTEATMSGPIYNVLGPNQVPAATPLA